MPRGVPEPEADAVGDLAGDGEGGGGGGAGGVEDVDSVGPVDPTVRPDKYLDTAALAEYPQQIRYHLWRNAVLGSKPSKNLCIRGTPQEKKVREEAREWMA